MGEYLFSIVALSSAAALLSYLSYPGELEATAKRAISLILVFFIVSPLPALVDSIEEIRLPDFSEEEYAGELEDYMEAVDEAFASGIRTLISDKFSLASADVSVTVAGVDITEMKAKRISILLSGRAVLSDVKRIEEYIESLGLGECEVRTSIDGKNN